MILPINNPYIRDEITIDAAFSERVAASVGDGSLYILARKITQKDNLRVGARPLVIVADEFVGNGFLINAAGASSTSPGNRGADAPPGLSGTPGGSGGNGGAGDNGGTVTLMCRHTNGVRISVSGGDGAAGGVGGNGGPGSPAKTIPGLTHMEVVVDEFGTSTEVLVHDSEDVEIAGTLGGGGGIGGDGGAGGNAGTIRFASIADDSPPLLEANGGAGGPGGAGGIAGANGAFAEIPPDFDPTPIPGARGDPGADGTISVASVTAEEYVAGLRPLLDAEGPSYANFWAPFRIWVGNYFYHRYNPSELLDRDRFSQLAAIEFARALELQPDNVDALRLQAQLVGVRQDVGTDDFIWVGGGNNALGLPRDMDVQPDVQTYVNAFAQFSNVAVSFLSIAMNTLDTFVQLKNLRELANLHQQQAIAAHENLSADLDTALSEKRLASEESERVQQMLDQTTADIQAAMAEMQESKVTFLGVVVTIAEVAAAVVGVVAGIASGGAGVVPLVAGLAALTDTAIQHAGPIADKLFEGKDLSDENDPDVKAIKTAYKNVDKEAEAVIKAGKSIVNFVQVIQKLTAVTTPDNSKYLTLVRRGVDLAYQVLVARNKVILTQQGAKAAQAKLDGAAAIVEDAKRLVQEIEGDAEPLRRSALAAIGVVQSKADALLGIAFRAQRSVEIYTLEAVEQDLLLDAGLLHPDDVRRYMEKEIQEPELVSLLNQSWLQLLEPTGIQQRYTNYFDRPHDLDVLRLSFTAHDPQFEELLNTRRLLFRVEATAIPMGRHDAKVTGVRLALVGAKHPANEVSCDVRHGAKYEQRRDDGTINVQELKSLVNNRVAKLESLGGDGGLSTDPLPPAPGSLAFWGRGIGGDWEVTLPAGTRNSGLDLSGLTEVQVWIGYRFLR